MKFGSGWVNNQIRIVNTFLMIRIDDCRRIVLSRKYCRITTIDTNLFILCHRVRRRDNQFQSSVFRSAATTDNALSCWKVSVCGRPSGRSLTKDTLQYPSLCLILNEFHEQIIARAWWFIIRTTLAHQVGRLCQTSRPYRIRQRWYPQMTIWGEAHGDYHMRMIFSIMPDVCSDMETSYFGGIVWIDRQGTKLTIYAREYRNVVSMRENKNWNN